MRTAIRIRWQSGAIALTAIIFAFLVPGVVRQAVAEELLQQVPAGLIALENLLKKPNIRSEDEDFNFVKHEVKKQTASTLFYSQILWFSTPTACGQMPRTSRSE